MVRRLALVSLLVAGCAGVVDGDGDGATATLSTDAPVTMAHLEGRVVTAVADPLSMFDPKAAPAKPMYQSLLMGSDGHEYLLTGDIPPGLTGPVAIERASLTRRGTISTLEISRRDQIRALGGADDRDHFQSDAEPQVEPRNIKVAVILVRFADFEDWMTPSAAREIVFGGDIASGFESGGVKEFYETMTHDRLRLVGAHDLSGDVYGKYTLPASFTWTSGQNCFSLSSSIVNEASALAAVDGFDVADYDSVAVIGPQGHPSCNGFGGIAFGKRAYNNASGWNTVAHEMGHTLGLGHSNAARCSDENGNHFTFRESGTTCDYVDYGDPFDLMGGAAAYFSGPAISFLGGFAPGEEKVVSQAGTYDLHSLESSGGTRSLRVDSRDGSRVFIEIRSRTGYDANLPETSAALRGLSIHVNESPQNGNSAPIHDADIRGDDGSRPWQSNAPLTVGRSVTWESKGLRITHLPPDPDVPFERSPSSAPRARVKVEYLCPTAWSLPRFSQQYFHGEPVSGFPTRYQFTISLEDRRPPECTGPVVQPISIANWSFLPHAPLIVTFPFPGALVDQDVELELSSADYGTYVAELAATHDGSSQYAYLVADHLSPDCVRAAPSIVFGPSSGGDLEASWGSLLYLQATITNNDSEACGPSQFAVRYDETGALPIGTIQTPYANVTVPPGSSVTPGDACAIMTAVLDDPGASPDFYTLSASVRRSWWSDQFYSDPITITVTP